MKKSLVWLAVGSIVMASGAALIGCGSGDQGSTRPATTELKDGLTVLSTTPTAVNAAFKANGRVVYFETRVGGLKPDAYRKAFPDEPQYEMDARFVDQEGRTFILVRGGDTLQDPTWEADIARGRALGGTAYLDHRPDDFLLARSAAGAMAASPHAPTYPDHVFHLVNATRVLPHENAKLVARAQDLATTMKPSSVVGEQAYNASNYWNWWEGDQYSKGIYLVANHSAVWGWNCGWNGSSCVWDENIVSCNHGTCANDGSMGYRWYTNSGWVSGNRDLAGGWNKEGTTSNQTVTASCQTGYNWNTPPGHDCNDDSAYEQWQIYNQSRGGSSYGTSGDGMHFVWTKDSNGNEFACDCNYTGNCNDWSVPASPGTH